MYTREFVLDTSLSRTPLHLLEALEGEKKKSWNLGYMHAQRGHPPDNANASDKKEYAIGYESGKQDKSQSVNTSPHLTPEASFGDIFQNIYNGVGLVPGMLHAVASQSPQPVEDAQLFTRKLAPHLVRQGELFISRNTNLRLAWQSAQHRMKSPFYQDIVEGSLHFAKHYTDALRTMGLSVIPEHEREARRADYRHDVVSRFERGAMIGGTAFLRDPASFARFNAHKKALFGYASEFFDAWGPLAEAAIKRLSFIQEAKPGERAGNTDVSFTFDDRRSFFHEMGHSIERCISRPDTRSGARTEAQDSYWRNRVIDKDPNPPMTMREATGNQEYAPDEMTKRDQWYYAYLGKLYKTGDSEVISCFAENASLSTPAEFGAQFRRDPSVLLEYLGFVQAALQGEMTRRDREAAKQVKRV